MPTCLAIGCANTTGKTLVKKSYYRMPKPAAGEAMLAERWLLNLQIGHTMDTFDFTKDKVVCEDHFHIDCYESLDYIPPELLPPDAKQRKRKLKDGSLPTIFQNGVLDIININQTKVSNDPSMNFYKFITEKFEGCEVPDFNISKTKSTPSTIMLKQPLQQRTQHLQHFNAPSSSSSSMILEIPPLTSIEPSSNVQRIFSRLTTATTTTYATILPNDGVIKLNHLNIPMHSQYNMSSQPNTSKVQQRFMTTVNHSIKPFSVPFMQTNDARPISNQQNNPEHTTSTIATTESSFNPQRSNQPFLSMVNQSVPSRINLLSPQNPSSKTNQNRFRLLSQLNRKRLKEQTAKENYLGLKKKRNQSSPNPDNQNQDSCCQQSHSPSNFKPCAANHLTSCIHPCISSCHNHYSTCDHSTCILFNHSCCGGCNGSNRNQINRNCSNQHNTTPRRTQPLHEIRVNSESPTRSGNQIPVNDSVLNDVEMDATGSERRKKLRNFMEDFQKEIDEMETVNVRISKDNITLTEENKMLKMQMQEKEKQYYESLKQTVTDLEKYRDGSSNDGSELKTILKLSNKLQELMDANEKLSQTNNELEKEKKKLQSENSKFTEQIEGMKNDNNGKSHAQSTIARLRKKFESYSKENTELKAVLKRAEKHIEDLNIRIESYKKFTALENLNSNSTQSKKQEKTRQQSENRNEKDAEHFTVNVSASALLKDLVGNGSNSAHKQRTISSETSEAQRIQSLSPVSCKNIGIEAAEDSSTDIMPKEEYADSFLDPKRFPACRKLLELSRAHQDTNAPITTTIAGQQMERQSINERASNASLSSLAESPLLPYLQNNSPTNINRNSDIQIYQRDDNSEEEIYQHVENGDEITVVIPSNALQQESRDDNQEQKSSTRDLMFTTSESMSMTPTNGNNINGNDAITQDSGGGTNKSETSMHSPLMKKIKTEYPY